MTYQRGTCESIERHWDLFFIQLRYKRRLYKGVNVDEKQLKALHTKSNLRRFLEYVAAGQCEKVTKMCAKGLDSNFHCPETGGNKFSFILPFYNVTEEMMDKNFTSTLDCCYRNAPCNGCCHEEAFKATNGFSQRRSSFGLPDKGWKHSNAPGSRA